MHFPKAEAKAEAKVEDALQDTSRPTRARACRAIPKIRKAKAPKGKPRVVMTSLAKKGMLGAQTGTATGGHPRSGASLGSTTRKMSSKS